MDKLTDRDLELVQTRIQEEYPSYTIVSEVFTSTQSQIPFTEGLISLSNSDKQIKVGGRSLRKKVGFTTFDFADVVTRDLHAIKDDPIIANRLRPLLRIYDNFPTERMTHPDLDFFIWGATAEEIIDTFSLKGFIVSKHEATGGVWVVEIHDKDKNGVATFVDGNMSWQTKDEWPMLGFKAEFKIQPEAAFHLDISAARLYLYPLAIPGIHNLNPLDPRRVAAIGRALLWSVTVGIKNRGEITKVKLPKGRVNRIKPPMESMQKAYFITVYGLGKLLRAVEKNPSLELMYRSGLRDMALALRIIALLDDEYELSYHNYDEDMKQFLLKVRESYYEGKYEFYDSDPNY